MTTVEAIGPLAHGHPSTDLPAPRGAAVGSSVAVPSADTRSVAGDHLNPGWDRHQAEANDECHQDEVQENSHRSGTIAPNGNLRKRPLCRRLTGPRTIPVVGAILSLKLCSALFFARFLPVNFILT